jgi:membrane fusion protein (multidrug efflux system)
MTTEMNPNGAAAAQSNGKRKKALMILAVVVVIAAVVWAAWYLLVARWQEDTDDAYVQGNIVSITPQTIGTVVSIGADDGMKVTAGQVLVQLDPNDAKVAYEQAVANLSNTVRQVRGLYSAVDSGQADLAARQASVERARADLKRREGLVGDGAVPKSWRMPATNCPCSKPACDRPAATSPATKRWSTPPRSATSRRCRPRPRRCARPTSTCSARRSSRR